MRDTIQRALIGGIFIGIGIGYFGRAMGEWEFTMFFPGWWAAIMIVLAFTTMISHGIHVGNTFFALLGTYFLLSANQVISFALTFPVLISLSCFCIAWKIIFRKKVTYYDYKFR